jgi:hypothetical protein
MITAPQLTYIQWAITQVMELMNVISIYMVNILKYFRAMGGGGKVIVTVLNSILSIMHIQHEQYCA